MEERDVAGIGREQRLGGDPEVGAAARGAQAAAYPGLEGLAVQGVRFRVRPGLRRVDAAGEPLEAAQPLRQVGEGDRVQPWHCSLLARDERALAAELDEHLTLVVPGAEGLEPE